MNAKFVVAVLVALQVSQALCEMPPADPDVVEKYDAMKALFKKRMENLWTKFQAFAENNEQAQAARQAVAGQEQKMGTFKELVGAVGDEVAPAVDKARAGLLGLYSAYMRPFVGPYVQQAYDNIKPILDKHLPADES